jgi:hypothetical protein
MHLKSQVFLKVFWNKTLILPLEALCLDTTWACFSRFKIVYSVHCLD